MAPELSEPIENLFNNLLKKYEMTRSQSNRTPKPETMNIDNPNPRPATPVNPDLESIFHPDLLTHKPIELKLAPLKPFTGNREELNSFPA